MKLVESLSQKAHLFLISIIILQLTQISEPSNIVGADLSDSSSLVSHDPITIDGDAQFNSSNGVVSGTGNSSDPYIIMNWSINVTIAIRIYNTRASVIIKNCEIFNGTDQTYARGIYLYNVTNVTISNVRLRQCRGVGIDSSSGCCIENASLTDNCIEFYNSRDSRVLNCTIRGFIASNSCDNHTYEGNYLNNGSETGGIYLVYCSNMKVTNNSLLDMSSYGIYMSGSNNRIIGNIIKRNGIDGIGFVGDDHQILNNTISYNAVYGVKFGMTTDLLFSNNTLTNNGKSGVYYIRECEGDLNDNLAFSNCTIDNHTEQGVVLINVRNGRVFNNSMNNNGGGMVVKGNCDGLSVYNNSFMNCSDTIILKTKNVRIHNNSITKSAYAFRCITEYPYNFDWTNANDTFENNTITHAGCYGFYPLGSAITIQDNKISDGDADYSAIFVNQNVACSIMNNSINKMKQHGIINIGNNGVISRNTIYNCIGNGIQLEGSSNKVDNNTIYNCSGNGIQLQGSSHTIDNNTIHDCNISGILLNGAGWNSIGGNTIYNNSNGIYMASSRANNVRGNYLLNNSCYGIVVDSWNPDCYIYNNWFNNTDNYKYPSGIAHWNITKTLGTNIYGGSHLGGNFWSNYTGWDIDDDGIGETNVPFGPGDWLPLIGDLMPPTIADNTTGIPTTGDLFTFSARIGDNHAVANVTLEYWIDSPPNSTINLSLTSGTEKSGTYNFAIGIHASANKIGYQWRANDTNDNRNVSLTYLRDVLDNDLPTATDLSGDPVTNASFTFSMEAQDNIGISNATVEYWLDRNTIESKLVGLPASGPYNHTILIPASAHYLSYRFSVSDLAGNTLRLPWTEKKVHDNIFPVIVDNSGSPNTGESFTIECTISDNIGVSKVLAGYSFDNGRKTTSAMIAIGTYKLRIGIPSSAHLLNYTIMASDEANNTAILTRERAVTDTLYPVITDLTGNATTGDELAFNINVTDNWQLTKVTLQYYFDNGPRIEIPYSGQVRITVPEGALNLTYVLRATDVTGKMTEKSTTKTVHDNDPPDISGAPPTPVNGNILAPGLNISDNIGPLTVTVTYRFDNGTETVLPYSENMTLPVPLSARMLSLKLMAIDGTGNHAEKSWNLAIVDADKPQIVDKTGAPATGQTITISIDVEDNRGPPQMEISCWVDEETAVTVADATIITYLIPEYAQMLHYKVRAWDATGNVNESTFDRPVKDSFPPKIMDLTTGPVVLNAALRVSATVTDNIRISNVTLEYRSGDSTTSREMTFDGTNYVFDVLMDKGPQFKYRIRSTDVNGNTAATNETTLDVDENPQPYIPSPGIPQDSINIGYTVTAAVVAAAVLVAFILILKRKKK